ncbi:MAG: SufD family Fe-S cluster assembly protein [bacterium]|nr:SufD family Fe-S cluster assembly protein [bacterium]
MNWKEELNKKAVGVQDKSALLGPDVDMKQFKGQALTKQAFQLPSDVADRAKTVGINPDEESRSGTFFQLDHSVILACRKKEIEGVEVMGTPQVVEQYDWLKDYYWKAVAVDTDKYTAEAETHQHPGGYFIRTKPGVRLTLPVQACLFIGTQGLLQAVHNIIIAEENSELHIITGCTTHPQVKNGMHIGISEFYIKKGATVTFTMIHGWAEDVEVRPRTGVIIEEGGTFISNYICFKPVKSLQMYPTSYLVGENSRVRYHTLIYGMGNSLLDVGSRAVLSARGARAEMTSRIIGKNSARIIARGHLVGEFPETKAHLDCRGLLLSSTAQIHSVPELEAKTQGCDLSHEAAVGKIEEAQLCYLMSRGLNEDEATALIVRGFLDPEVPGLPQHLKQEVRKTIELTSEKVM